MFYSRDKGEVVLVFMIHLKEGSIEEEDMDGIEKEEVEERGRDVWEEKQ